VHERAVILSEAKNFRLFSKHPYQNSQRCFASLNMTESIDADVNAKIDNRPQSGLVRALGPIDAMMIVIGSMIGSGIFITSAESSRLSGAPGWLLLTWSNTRGLEVGKIIQNTFTFAKTAALAAVVVIGLSLGWNANSGVLRSDWWNSWSNGWSPQVAQPGFAFVGGLALVLLFGRS